MSQNDFYDISIITVVYNNAEYISDCLKSVQNQKNVRIQHIIVDGGSDDGTLDIVSQNIRATDVLISEPDKGIYDALNKGIAKSEARLVGILHSDDLLKNDQILSIVLEFYKHEKVDLMYGDLTFIDRESSQSYRKWTSSKFKKWKLFFGWMPAHPTCFYDRNMLVEENIYYDINFKISGDYEYLLKILTRKNVSATYIPQTITLMRSGGASNGSIKKKRPKDI